MNSVDLAIIVFVAILAIFGWMRGFWFTAFEYAGVIVGFAVAAVLIPPLLERFDLQPGVRLLAALFLLSSGAMVGSAIARLAGEPARRLVRMVPLVGIADALCGAALTAVVALASVWYLGLSLSRGPSEQVAQAVQQSVILRRVDAVAPAPPAVLARLERVLSGQVLPQLFAGLEPPLPGHLEPPAAVDTAGVRQAATSTVRVEALGCGGVNLGSGFAVGPQLILTNAHVVSGTRDVAVAVTGVRRPLDARVVVFDPARDLAVLAVPGLQLAPLAPAEGHRGTPAAIVGFPGGGSIEVTPAIISGAIRARGRDIYQEKLVTREIWVVSGRARPGNSGGPLVDLEGRLLGVVFAGSLSRPSESYAITAAEAHPVVAAANRSEPVDTRAFDCVS